MSKRFYDHVEKTLTDIRNAGLEKSERIITSAQQARIGVTTQPKPVLNLCANNYLGLANHPEIIAAAHEGLDSHGYGLASVRFICGTQDIHKQLETKLSEFLGTQDTILYNSCFDANGGLFETLLGDEDAVISDSLNHASIIDGIRLCKAKRFRYANNDMSDLEAKLKEADAAGARFKLISTDGVFSMDGTIAQLDKVCDLADKYDALVHFDDCHATGFMGTTGGGGGGGGRGARTNTATASIGSTSPPARSARPSAVHRAGTRRGENRSSTFSVSVRGRTSSVTRSRRRSCSARSRRSSSSRGPANCATAFTATRVTGESR